MTDLTAQSDGYDDAANERLFSLLRRAEVGAKLIRLQAVGFRELQSVLNAETLPLLEHLE